MKLIFAPSIKMTTFLAVMVTAISLAGCGGSSGNTKGSSFGYLEAEPPVAANTPVGFNPVVAAGLAAKAAVSELPNQLVLEITEKIKQDIFSRNYPRLGDHTCQGVISCALKSIDSRMLDLEKENIESKRECVDGPLYSQTLSFPLGESVYNYSQSLQCAEKLSVPTGFTGEQWVNFGKDQNKFYLDFQQSQGIMYLATVDTVTENVEAFIAEESNRVYRINSNKQSGLLEITGNYQCGFHMKNNANFAYVEIVQDVSGGCDVDTPKISLCLDTASLVAVDIVNCETQQLTSFTMDSIISWQLNNESIETITKDLTFIKSLPNF